MNNRVTVYSPVRHALAPRHFQYPAHRMQPIEVDLSYQEPKRPEAKVAKKDPFITILAVVALCGTVGGLLGPQAGGLAFIAGCWWVWKNKILDM